MKDKVVLVTGASGQIGGAIAKEFASKGAKIALHYNFNEQIVKNLSAELEKSEIFKCDLTDSKSVELLPSKIANKMGKIDAIINNASHGDLVKPINEITLEYFNAMFYTNVLAPTLLIKNSIQFFSLDGASIINISSVNAHTCRSLIAMYAASKSALENITLSFARELGSKKIRVNAICVGPIDNCERPKATISLFSKNTPLENRLGTNQEIAKVAYFLATPQSYWINGRTITVDGGFSDF